MPYPDDRVVLQRGNRVKIDSKGVKTRESIGPEDVEAQIASNNSAFGKALVDDAYANTTKKLQDMPNRRDAQIDAVGYKRGGKVSQHYGHRPMTSSMKHGKSK